MLEGQTGVATNLHAFGLFHWRSARRKRKGGKRNHRIVLDIVCCKDCSIIFLEFSRSITWT